MNYIFQSNDEQWQRAMEYVSLVSELNYMTQVSQKFSGIQSIVKKTEKKLKSKNNQKKRKKKPLKIAKSRENLKKKK